MLKNVLIPIDGSEVAAAAIAVAAGAVGPDAKVTVLEVVDSIGVIVARTSPAGFPLGPVAYDPDILESVIRTQRSAAEKHLATAAASLKERGIQNVDTAIREGIPGEVIVQTARDLGVDVVAMGTHGRSGLFRTVLGSVAEHVVRHLRGVPAAHFTGRTRRRIVIPRVAARPQRKKGIR